MVQEIIYTSAEKGLKQGSRGFCTVVATAGIPINLAERLESMSGYRQIFPLGDPRAALNPVAYSHITTRIAGQSLHVVSRVADAGQDYTGRSNKLAHHLAFGDGDCIPVGPARLLTHPGFVVERWNGDVKNISPRQLPQIDTPETIHLTAWHAVTGDHGWAGSIAEQLASSPVPVHIIFPLGTNTLLLTQEVLDLLPPAQRWDITFSTYFTRLLAGTECQLRFIPDDTAEATAVRNDARAKVVDLTKPLPPASAGNLVSLARTAIIKTEHTRPATSLAGSPATAISSTTATPGSRHAPTQPTLTPAPGGKATKQSMTLANRQPSLLPDLPDAAPRRGRFLVIGAITVLLMVATIIVILATRPDNNDAYTALAGHNPNSGIPNAEAIRAQRELLEKEKAARDHAAMEDAAAAKKAAELAKQADEEKQKTEREQHRLAQEERDRIERDKQEKQRAALENAGPFALLGAAVAAKDPVWSDGRGQWLFELPKPQHNQSSAQLPLRLHGQLLELAFLDAATQILPKDLLLPSIRKDDSNPDTWQLTATVGGQSVPLGSYRLNRLTPANDTEADAQLQFTWSVDASRETEAAEIARWLPLELRVGNRKIALLQRKPESPQSLEHIPTWSSWCEVESMTQVSTTALKAIRVTEIKQLSHGFYISDSGAPEHAIQLNSKPNTNALTTNTENPPKTERYFLLSRPIQLLEKRPDPEAATVALGYGRLTFTSQNDLSVLPEVRLLLKLPSRERFIPDIPSRTLQKQFVDIEKNPVTFMQFAGNSTNEWDALKINKMTLSLALQDQLKRFQQSPEWWHEQPIDGRVALPVIREFESRLGKIADAAVSSVRKYEAVLKARQSAAQRRLNAHMAKKNMLIPTGRTVGEKELFGQTEGYRTTEAQLQKIVRECEQNLKDWQPFIPAVSVYGTLTQELIRETESGLEGINKNYTEAERATRLWITAGKA
ncbi:MAG: hypothetical protein ACK5X8_17295, partial [Planctomyces sp.]